MLNFILLEGAEGKDGAGQNGGNLFVLEFAILIGAFVDFISQKPVWVFPDRINFI